MSAIRPVSIDSVGVLSGKKIFVTGGNSGIGLEAAKMFAARQATVLLGCRDSKKGLDAASLIRAETPEALVQVISIDLGSLASIREAAKQLESQHADLDVLVHNAGVMALPFSKTQDGFETQLGVNHLGGFALTALLAPTLMNREGARVVSTSSLLARSGQMHFDDLMGEKSYDKNVAYNQSKLANQLFAYELERRLRAAGKKAQSLACHPGYSATNLQSRGPQAAGSKLGEWVMAMSNAVVAQKASKGAHATVIAAASPDVRGGELVGFDGLMEMRGNTAVMEAPKLALETEAAARLWAESERLTGITFAI